MSTLLEEYLRERPMLLRVAYKILGSQTEAEDALQDLYLKIKSQGEEGVDNARSWLIRVMVNAAIDQKRAMDRRKVDYVGSWLPEPWAVDGKTRLEVRDDVSMALMVLLERLNPIERAVFVLRETCDLKYGEIADILRMSEASCRKSWQRAEGHLEQGRKRFQPDPSVHKHMTLAFLEYWSQGNTEELIKLLKAEAVLHSDGGGKVSATLQPIAGAMRIIKFLQSLLRAAGPDIDVSARFLPPDQTCLVVNGELETLICMELEGECITNLYFQRNPDKLKRVKDRLTCESE